MNWKEYEKAAIEKLQPVYGLIESKSMMRILHEDIFNKKTELSNEDEHQLENVLERLQKFEPVQYITGKSFFYGLSFYVDQHVLIPRPETEELVDLALQIIGNQKLKVLDIGTGSGCIPVTLKYKCSNTEVHAIDVSPQALNVAKRNANAYTLDVYFSLLDFLDENQWNKLPADLDLIVSNPPYIAYSEKELMSVSTVKFEPHVALFAGEDALIFYKRIALFSKTHLKKGGMILLELNEYLAEEIKNVFLEMGYEEILMIKDINEKSRMLRIIL